MGRHLPSFPSSTPPPGPRSRTSQVLAGGLGVALFLLLVVSVGATRATSTWAWWVLILGIGVLWWTLRRRTRSVAEGFARSLDERDLAARNAAAWWGLCAALIAGCVGALGLLIAARIQTLDARSALDRGGAVLLTLMIAAATVPTITLAISTSPTDIED